MRVITLNVNGIRSAIKKGLLSWLSQQNADFICLQEIRAQLQNETDAKITLEGYHSFFHDAEKKGYSGVGIFSKHTPQKITTGLGWPSADKEGRYLELQFPKFTIASIYIPSGTTSDIHQSSKYDFLARYFEVLKNIKESDRDFIISGDLNIAHKNIDLKNWRTNQKHSGFLPEERAWLDEVIDELGFVDAFRAINKESDQYTWWSNRGRAFAKNVGWRIDYQIITPKLKDKIISVSIYKDQRFSDHAPLIIDYDINP